VFKPPAGEQIRNFCIPGRDGRLIVLMGARNNPDDVNVWEIRTDLHTGAALGQPRRLTDWREGRDCWQISASADGKRIVLLTRNNQPDAYVAGFDQRNARLEPPKRLTLSERSDYPSAWTPDSRSVIFTSTRVGPQSDIYKQDIDAEEPQLLVTGEGNKDLPRVTGDGRWILFVQSKVGSQGWTRGTSEWANTRVMRAPIDGGMAEEVYASAGSAVPQCSVSDGCIIADARGDRIVISRLDPIKGKGPELATIPNVETAYISPDGTEFAYVPEEGIPQNHIRIVSFVGKPTREIVVGKASFLYNLHWLPDGSGWFTGNITEPHNQLLFVARDGSSHVLWAPEHTAAWSALPSPDSKYVALWTLATTGNAWLLTGY